MSDTAVIDLVDIVNAPTQNDLLVQKIDAFLDEIKFQNIVKSADVFDFALDLRLLATAAP